MPARSATRRYSDPVAFWREYHTMLRRGSLLLSKADLGGDTPADLVRVDLVVPGAGRVGPVLAQPVQQLPDGSAAFRVDALPDDVKAAVETVRALVDGVRAWLIESKEVVPRDAGGEAEIEGLRKRVGELEAELEAAKRAKQGLAAAVARAGAQQPAAPAREAAAVAVEASVPRGRGFPLPDLSSMEPSLRGRRDDGSLREALMRAAVEKRTGILVLKYPDGLVRWGFWQKGGPVGWRAEPIQEQEVMGMLLFRAGSLSEAQLAQSLEIMERRGVRQGDALIEMGVITFAQLVLILQKQCDFVLQKVLLETTGEWAFYEVEEHIERFVPPPARVAAMLFRALRARAREMPAEDLTGALAPNLDRYVFLADGVERTFEEMRMTPDEQQFVKIVRGTSYRLRELSSVSNLSRSQTATMVWCLQTLGLLVFRSDEAAARGSERVARELLARKSTMQRGTLFDRLELHWICTSADVEAAWARLAQTYGPDHVDDHGPEWRSTMELIAAKMQEAYERLRTDASRREYRSEVFEKMMIEQSAAILAEKGEMAFMKANGNEALDCFVRAAELMPKHDAYRAGLQRARAMASPS